VTYEKATEAVGFPGVRPVENLDFAVANRIAEPRL